MIKMHKDHWLSGFQWYFFIFCNTVLIPPTLQSAFNLSDAVTLTITQYSFIATALGSLVQVFAGHQRAIMEGPTGLWWATILGISVAEASFGTSAGVTGANIAIGIACAGLITLVIGITGAGARIARIFTPTVMAVFMFMMGAQLISIFLKGMLGLPFGIMPPDAGVNYPVFFLALATLFLVLGLIIYAPASVAKYALLIGVLLGWGAYVLLFSPPARDAASGTWQLLPLGNTAGFELRWGVIITCVLTGLLNISNTFGAIRATDVFYMDRLQENSKMYRRSFMVTGTVTLLTSPLAVVPFAPFVSSVGLITQTNDSSRTSLVVGAGLFLLMGLITPLTLFFSGLPLAIGSAVMLATYLPLLFSSLSFVDKTVLNPRNIYRLAVPLFTGIFLINPPAVFISDLPVLLRPLLGNGMLVAILLAVVSENLVRWDKIK
ncbi:uracil/xanthine transporter [Morganella psychrotolerans]|uniref:Uracil/xanthine transporter n=1 Tax=Morganella psychrotolerans TaxID=368603 RepID=A0A1B8H833_9GAMM|nr:uracil/xanthine transporter [Morganella psychrotolerans]OBU05210.1 uracil/xanthine transporter [Morganella psychrotolerans]